MLCLRHLLLGPNPLFGSLRLIFIKWKEKFSMNISFLFYRIICSQYTDRKWTDNVFSLRVTFTFMSQHQGMTDLTCAEADLVSRNQNGNQSHWLGGVDRNQSYNWIRLKSSVSRAAKWLCANCLKYSTFYSELHQCFNRRKIQNNKTSSVTTNDSVLLSSVMMGVLSSSQGMHSDVTSWESNRGATWETGVLHNDSSRHMEPAAAAMPASTALPHQHYTTVLLQAEGTPLTCAA